MLRLLCYFGFHKIDKRIMTNSTGSIYIIPEDETKLGNEDMRYVKKEEGHCKWCGDPLSKILSNEDIHIGI
jgi:hypothetical protein